MATVVFVHAHPDDEAILTAGTMRALVDAGHRVVLVLATDGAAGLTDTFHSTDLGKRRLEEAQASATALGISERIWLGFADSGLDGKSTSHLTSLCAADLEESAASLAAILIDHGADVVVGYDARGGYGHPDHVRVHELVHRAAEIAQTPNVFEATLSRQTIQKFMFPLIPLGALFGIDAINNLRDGFSAREALTHVVNVNQFLEAKRQSMRAHASQTVGGALPRSLQLFLALPDAIFTRILGREYFVHTRGDRYDNAIAQLPTASVLRGSDQ